MLEELTKGKGMSIKIALGWEVVKVVDLKEITPNNKTPSYLFRVEILKEYGSRGKYRARVYRKETFRIQPTFPQKDGTPQYEPSDEAVFIEDYAGEWEEIKGKTAMEVLQKVLRKIRMLFQA